MSLTEKLDRTPAELLTDGESDNDLKEMNLIGRKVWQQAAGDTNRNYSELCLRWGVILNGPARYGPWPTCVDALKTNGWGSRKITDLERFAEGIGDGDVVVLRLGTSEVHGVGIVVGGYEWSDSFGDVDGWDLQHVRRVKWLWHLKDGTNVPKLQSWDLKLGDTTQPLKTSGPVWEWLKGLEVPLDITGSLPDLPASDKAEIDVEKISEYLFDRGVASQSIGTLVDQMDDLQRIAKWYSRSKGAPSEHETVAYLVVPLLRTLGWTPQRMAVEWNRVDVALFDKLPRSDATLRVVVEAKKMSDSCLTAFSQAAAYATSRTKCDRLIVTDGLRYGVYVQNASGKFILHAYMNLERLRTSYPVYDCFGAREAIWAMTPEWLSELKT